MALNLPTPDEMYQERKGKPIPKGETRLETAVVDRTQAREDDAAFKASVWHRDRNRCRCCGRKVQKLLGRLPERGEVHHLHGRIGPLRHEVRAAILLCLTCHERLTGRVNQHRLIAAPTKTFQIGSMTYTDARHTILFTEAKPK